ncbi:DUF3971 domain-containing protein [SAR116 cluster bacterium]|nr:DUF3971 domain-containing protein [SAR116 cluster bacterium]
MKNISFPIFNVLASTIGIASIIIFLFIWQASSIIFNLEGVQKEIESRITKEFPVAKVSIKKINLSFEDFASPFGISVKDIIIANKREKLEIKESKLFFSLTNILSGNFNINKVIIDGLNFRYHQDTHSEKFIPSLNNLKIPRAITDLINKKSSDIKTNYLNKLLKETEYKIVNGKINFENLNNDIEIKNINVVFQNLENRIFLDGDFNLNNNYEKIKVSFDDNTKNEININLSFSKINFEDFKEFNFFPSLETEVYLGGKMKISLDEAYFPFNITGFLNFEKSKNKIQNIEEISFLNNFYKGKIEFNYDYKNNFVSSENFTFEDSYQSVINGSFKANNLGGNETSLYIDANLNSLNADIIPQDIIPKEYKLELSQGVFNDLNFKGNILINNSNLSYFIEDFDIEGLLKELKVTSSSENSSEIDTLISSNFRVKIKSDNIISIDTITKFKNLTFQRHGMLKAFSFEEAKFSLNYKNNKIKITNLSSDLYNGTTIIGEINLLLNKENLLSEAEINLNFNKILYSSLIQIWPNDFGQKTKHWINKNVKGGFAKDCELSLIIDFIKTPKVKNLQLNWLHKDSKISFYKNLPALILPEARISINRDQMIIDFKEASLARLDIGKGKLNISPIFNRMAKASLKIRGQSDLQNALKFLNHKDLNLISKYRIGTHGIGKVFFETNFTWPIKPAIKRDEFLWNLNANGKDLVLSSLPLNLRASESEIKISASNQSFKLLSEGKLNNIETKFKIDKLLNTNPSVRINLIESRELVKYISNITGHKIEGSASGLIEIKDLDFSNFISKVVIDLDNTRINLPQINFFKELGIKGIVKGDFIFESGLLTKISNLQGEVGNASFGGKLELKNSFFKEAKFNYISLPGSLISSLHIVKDENKKLILEIDSEKINFDNYITYFSNNNKETNELNVLFKINSEKFLLPGGIVSSGEINGNFDSENGLEAILKGTVYLGQEIDINDANISTKIINKQIVFSGTGLINEIPISIKSEDKNVFIISGDNAGKILKGLKITDFVEGGSIVISVKLDEQNFGNYSALIDVSKFNIVNAPILVRLISTLSLTGLLNLLEEQGIYFAKGVAEIDNFDNKFNIRSIEAIGEAMAITLDGWLDKKNDFLQIYGTMAPATLLNKLLEPVPVLSELLTGGDKAGIVLTEFRLDGNISKPTISFRPLSSAPGLLRDVFNIFRSDKE